MEQAESSKNILKITGIKQRWIVNAVIPVIALVLVAVAAFSLLVYNYYYTTVQTDLEFKTKTAAESVSNYIAETNASFYDAAYEYVASFKDSNKLELQFINSLGRVTASSYTMRAGLTPGTADIQTSLATGTLTAWRGHSSGTREHVLAVTAPLVHSNGATIGGIRFVTSLKTTDREILKSISAIVGIGILVIAFVVLSNMFFIRSVVDPIREITAVTRRIADGSYGAQIEKHYPDEIGVMVDSINEMSTKVSHAEKSQTEFISSVSHELRTPLTAITGWGETLSYDESLDGDAQRGINIILKEARRLTKMVEELLEFTRMEDGRFTLNVEKMDVGVELEDSIFTYQELLRQDELELEYDPYEDELPLINGDPERLKQVFLNLLDNAAKYGREGKRIIVSLGLDQSWVYINIRDFGPGIPEDELERVKMKFYKGGSKQRGSGIGLAVVDEIVKYHGGEFVLSNAPDGGLIATVKLPVDQGV